MTEYTGFVHVYLVAQLLSIVPYTLTVTLHQRNSIDDVFLGKVRSSKGHESLEGLVPRRVIAPQRG